MKKINWFWSHQRNMTLLQIELVAKGFRGLGYHPKLRFDFDNQLFVYVPDKGIYLFYDEDLMKQRMLQLQEDVQKHGNEIIEYYNKKTNQFFGHLLMISRDIDNTNLELMSNKELKKMFQDFKDAITIGPIITIQLWGIESCWLEESELTKFLKKKISEEEFNTYRQKLSACTGKTVAYAEREEFLNLCSYFAEKGFDESMLQKHIQKYGWITAEYRSEPWKYEKWLQIVNENIGSAKQQLEKQRKEYETQIREKNEIIRKLNPPEKVMKVIHFLDACNVQRDWSKGKYCEAYLYFRTLTKEIGKRLGLTFEEVYGLKTEEIESFLEGKPINKGVIRNRLEKGHMLMIKSGLETVHEYDKVEKIMKEEGIYDFFHKKHDITEAKGIPACNGKAVGKARVLDSAKGIKDFQKGEILITYMTTMEFTPLFPKAKAIVCDEGGVSSHAAIVSREFNIPCIVGAKNAMKFIKTGDQVEVDANTGIVKLLEFPK